jgi:small GTP-binding protein
LKNISAPTEPRRLQDHDFGNLILVFSVGPADSDKTIEINYRVERNEKSPYSATASDTGRFLQPERLVPANQTFQKLAAEITRGKESTMERGRALYDHVASQMKYDKSGSGWGAGDAVHACQALAGNCTDFHAYFIALARAAGIPARFAIGASIPADKDEGTIAGYHCWAEFLADGSWVPVDISEATKKPCARRILFRAPPGEPVRAERRTRSFGDADSGFGSDQFPHLSVAGGRWKDRQSGHGICLSAHEEEIAVHHFVVATAGHVDHGKSALVHALTGTDPDRLPEEKLRGITIQLGFAHLLIPASESRPKLQVGIVDVPGHEDFVKNMVAGVGAIDLALLVIAADDGWMPQTEEHLQILIYLGVTRAVIALSKIDLASADGAMVTGTIREKLRGTSFR